MFIVRSFVRSFVRLFVRSFGGSSAACERHCIRSTLSEDIVVVVFGGDVLAVMVVVEGVCEQECNAPN